MLVLILAIGPCAQQAAVSDDWGVIRIPKGSKIKVGFAAALSGLDAKLGIDIKNGVQMAVAEKGKIKDFDVELEAADDQCQEATSVTVAKEFVANPLVVGAVAHMCDAGSIPASKIYEEAKMVMISPSSTSLELAQKGLPIFFRTCWNEVLQGKEAASFAVKTLKVKRVAVLHDGSAYGQGLAEEFKRNMEAAGGATVAYEGVAQGETDFSGAITKIKPLNPDLVYFGGAAAEGASIVKEIRREGMNAIFMGGHRLFDVRDYIEASGSAAEGSYVTYAKNPQGAKYADWKKRYELKYGPVGTFSAEGYDAVMILLNAVEKVAKAQGDGNLAIGKKALADAIRATRYSGVKGEFTFDANGDRSGAVVVVNKGTGSKFQEVK